MIQCSTSIRRRAYPLAPSSVGWLDMIFRNPILNTPGGTVIRKTSALPMYVTQHTLVSVAKLKGFEVKIHGHYYLISRPSVSTVRLDICNDIMEAGIAPYILGRNAC